MGKNFLDPDTGLLYKHRRHNRTFESLIRESEEPDYYTGEELYAAKGGVMTFDIECYPNYFLVAFKHYYSHKVVTFELFEGRDVFDSNKLLWVMHNFCIIGFNSNKFDMPILWLAMRGASIDELQEAVVMIIKFGAMPREIEAQFKFKMGHINTVDLMDVAPLQGSLKAYAGRLHAPRLQDLPFPPDTELTEEQADYVKLYCITDLDDTELLAKDLEPQLGLRATMSDEYHRDLRSKSDAQIAETVITSEVKKLKGGWTKRPKVSPGATFKYQIPDYVSFKTKALDDMLEKLRTSDFTINENGGVVAPTWLIDPSIKNKDKNSFKVKIGHSTYRMGTGGLHSCESSACHVADEDTLLIDRDVASYYPRIILNQELFPKHLGREFLIVYETIVERRLKAKAEKNKVDADSLKIVVNGSFGKLGNRYSNLYAPDLMIQVTLSGQISLLMLIEMMELASIPVVSGNTDGIVMKCPQSRYDDLNTIVAEWESITSFETEETRYKSLYSKDVNNYMAIKLDDSIKLKGAYKKPGLQKNPTSTICNEAVTSLIVGNIPIEDTINNCKDITKFVTTRNVRGGAFKNKTYLGKIVRWVYRKDERGTINYVMSGNKVPKSEGAWPVMDLPNTFPDWIDYDRYINETLNILYDIDYLQRAKQGKIFDCN